MKGRLFYTSTITLLCGVALGSVADVQLSHIVWVFLISLGLMCVGSRKSETTAASHIFLLSIGVCFFALGLLRFETASWHFGHSTLQTSVGETVELSGIVVKEPDVRQASTHLYVEVGDDTVLVTTDRITEVAYGDQVLVTGVLKKPESFVSELGREFNYPLYLLVKGVEYQASFAQVTVASSGHKNVFVAQLLAIKHRLMTSIESALSEPQAGLGEGLLLGVKQGLGEELEAVFRTSGIIHIVVLSGYNVMLIVGFMLYVLSFFLRRRLRLVVALCAVASFALLVGLSATVVRASVMAGLLLFAQFLGRTYDLTRSLLFAGTVMVVLNPYLLVYDIGFQLSFMATLGLLLVAPQFETFITDGLAILKIKDFLVATIATQIAVLPLLLYYMGEVSLVAVAVNVLVLPVVPLAMLATFAVGVVGMVAPFLIVPCALVAHFVLAYIIAVARFFAELPFASFTVPPFGVWWVAILYSGIAGGVWYVTKRSTHRGDRLAGWVIEEELERADSPPGGLSAR